MWRGPASQLMFINYIDIGGKFIDLTKESAIENARLFQVVPGGTKPQNIHARAVRARVKTQNNEKHSNCNKTINFIGISCDEAEAQGLLLSHRRQVGR